MTRSLHCLPIIIPVIFIGRMTLQDWFFKLCRSGFDVTLATIFLWEGVTYYLPDDVIKRTFHCIASCSRAVVAYDVYYKWFSLDPRTIALMSRGYGTFCLACSLRVLGFLQYSHTLPVLFPI